ncbi:hypothetical protein HNR60_002203 [Rhodopseudomonas rhenobacensis]|uniref:Uncharacterized protein n=1 Tax=Rhodopseudomonas rhenobacensis TaxID=87461 RepID=A0A7W8DYY9_9BRAD|nr:hypothetical protein [Rhodopseudomonas rhenobacensis]MBB5047448.1 hypothetical protein [Rhodopseudomonas rhenobacensis]
MLKYIGNIFHTILPSVLATVLGAYIVNHYINKPDAPPAAAVSAIDSKKADETAAPAKAAKVDAKSASLGDSDAPVTLKSKPSTDKAERSGADKADKAAADKAAADKAEKAEKIERTGRTHQPMLHDRAVAKTAPAPAPAPTPAPAAVAAVTATPPVEPTTKEERRDANDLARAAIERLRNSNEAARAAEPLPRAPEPAKQPDPPYVASVPPAPAMPSQPPAPASLTPPPAAVTPPVAASNPVEPLNRPVTILPPPTPAYAQASNPHDPQRPTPPADIPESSDARADAGRSVGDDMFSAAKSVFHAVVPR